MIRMISDGFKRFAFKRGNNMCSLEKIANKAIGEKKIAPIIRTAGTQRKDTALSTEIGKVLNKVRLSQVESLKKS